ncbi:MAG: 2-C-methyl-D-erythritol 4-phosphate cytidylyltransferase [Candidatus Dactylopiibacterium carminicum]|uniref:2-C-methyl-D-erythritol 4-phosphate cytidylyltransferase n=1 Tax=Candidatus Dactylopiibacterium carminicum TaxID=857335 RepID=A0A272EQR9_9RHOO|nr:2-C-methyl-D-erythritol 4-phosphate cytidylyltransferase [Candidatus Dactylopiibacterium carminicum]KAF7599272.1 2-C-methyl-D-erythritol 4-phosphate cytidylyltransferase [Candidatus Dactylopiibacterium carminicum]PAS92434.1 MAG: 2-C-methyl-D-erythritol 4-phosphate cytidylyltransferase [Candidatus Dactylopiibacterium carminicum]PAS97178.1 MAG: 2-C-methyl-D-erythritol 4-phosphate cytidylyltransferase [Candidatus Dactylopiibacterium carminicum]PAS99279.1 MAG: 2-C-methyl-D-erythritol 4-phosphate
MSRHFAIVPAAGSGSRMGAERPKQYLMLAGKPLLWHALATLCAVTRIEQVCVVLSPEDEWWAAFDWILPGDKLRVLRVGGATRAESVTNALQRLEGEVRADDWMLVHDAARACLDVAQVDALIDTLAEDEIGGLLAQPVADTLKRANVDVRVAATISREAMWQAQTPQMFRHGLLLRALTMAQGVTDEAGAVEALGLAPRLVAADATNFKVTYPQDLALAEIILRARGKT